MLRSIPFRLGEPLAVLMLVALLFAGRIALIPAQVPLDYNEGWNAFQALAAMGPGPLYPPVDALAGNNYPPLSFYVVGLVGRLTGDLIIAGRLVSFTSLIIVGAAIWWIVRQLSPGRSGAPLAAVAIFAGFNATVFRAYVGMNDPQWLGHVFMLAGLALLLGRRSDHPMPSGRASASIALMMLGGLVKHNLVGIPLSAGLWLLLHDRRALSRWIVAASLFAVLVLIEDHILADGQMLRSILGLERTYSVSHMLVNGAISLLWLPLILLLGPLVSARTRDSRYDLLLCGVSVSVPLGIIESSGSGVDVNAHFEALIFLSIACPVACTLRTGQLPRGWTATPAAIAMTWAGVASANEIHGLQASELASREIVSRIASTPGPVACETLALCYWAGKGFSVDFFANNQRLLKGHDRAGLAAALDRKAFAVIEVDNPYAKVLASPVQRLIARHYVPTFAVGNQHLFVPAGSIAHPR